MAPKTDALWKFDAALLTAISWCCLLVGVYCFGWAVLLLFGQCIAWLNAGEWQPVPLYSLFLNEDGQSMLSVYTRLSPLGLVPSWGSFTYLDQIATSIAGAAAGFKKIVTWVLDLPLAAVLVVAGFASTAGCGVAAAEAKASRTT